MKELALLLSSVAGIGVSIAQPCGSRYLDSLFISATVQTVQFGQNTDYAGNPVALFADVYTPTGDTANDRAAIIYVHGGGFVGGTRNDANITRLCTQLAKKGYVVASIDYRIGVLDTTNAEKGKAQLRAVQDLNAFVRSAKAASAVFRIDTTKILITGGSAGGATILAKAFLDYAELPSYMDTTGVGTLEGASNSLSNTTDVFAAYSLWGAVGDTTWIQPGDIPVGAIQSIFDPCIPWDFGPSCNVPGYSVFGSRSIHTRATNLGIPTTLHGFQSSQHDLGMDSIPFQDTTIMLLSTFYYDLMCTPSMVIAEDPGAMNVLVYPNPFHDRIQVSPPQDVRSFSLVDHLGRTVYTGDPVWTQDLSGLPTGIYVLRMGGANSTTSVVLVKE